MTISTELPFERMVLSHLKECLLSVQRIRVRMYVCSCKHVGGCIRRAQK